jgi:small-conductance mechanosensitive channel
VAVLAAISFDNLVSASTVSGWDIALAVISLVVFWVFARLAGRAVHRLVGRLDGISDDLRSLAVRVARYFFLLLGVGVALSILGAPIEPLLTAAVIVAVVAVLAVRGIADNFAAGVVIQTRRPIHVGDQVESLGFVGTVEELSSRAVVIRTEDGRTVHLPNSKVLDNPIVNHSTAGCRRSEVEVRLRGGPPAAELEPDLLDAARTVAGVAADPAPGVLLVGVDPDRATLRVRFWHEPTASAVADVAGDVVTALSTLLRDRSLDAAVVTPAPAPPSAPAAPL